MSASILRTSNELTKRQALAITSTQTAVPLKQVAEGQIINVEAYVVQNIIPENGGESFDSILVKDKDGTVYATRSTTFIQALEDIWKEVYGDGEDIEIIVSHGISRSGREFATCSLKA